MNLYLSYEEVGCESIKRFNLAQYLYLSQAMQEIDFQSHMVCFYCVCCCDYYFLFLFAVVAFFSDLSVRFVNINGFVNHSFHIFAHIGHNDGSQLGLYFIFCFQKN